MPLHGLRAFYEVRDTYRGQILLGKPLALPALLDHFAHFKGDPVMMQLLCLSVQLCCILCNRVLLVLACCPWSSDTKPVRIFSLLIQERVQPANIGKRCGVYHWGCLGERLGRRHKKQHQSLQYAEGEAEHSVPSEPQIDTGKAALTHKRQGFVLVQVILLQGVSDIGRFPRQGGWKAFLCAVHCQHSTLKAASHCLKSELISRNLHLWTDSLRTKEVYPYSMLGTQLMIHH